MARVHLLTVHPATDPRAFGGYAAMLENARLDRVRRHEVVHDPDAADLILFVEIDTGRLCEDVLRHPFVKKYREKCFLFSTDWRVIPFLPGVYTSIEKSWYLPGRSRPGFYLSCVTNPLVQFEPGSKCDLLYSFMGDLKTHPVRRILAGLLHPRGQFVDTSNESQAVMWKGTPEQKEVFWSRYVALAKRSRFILCPRGVSPSSIRLFEAMCLGRVPVILSDEWLEPAGPDWSRFTLRVPESDAAHVPQILEQAESRAEKMGLLARAEWEKHFAPEIVFDRAVELCLEVRASRKLPETLSRLAILPQLLRPRNLRELVRQWRGRWRG